MRINFRTIYMVEPKISQKMKQNRLIFFFTTLLVSGVIRSQSNTFPNVNYIFSPDSLIGFDENSAKQDAFHIGCFGSEFKVYMYYSKRNFVNSKFNLKKSIQSPLRYEIPKVTGACLNDDFESSPTGTITNQNQIAGWTITAGINNITGGSCNLTIGCCTLQPNAAELVSNGYVDFLIGPKYPIFSVFGSNLNSGDTVSLNAPLGNMYGNNFIRLNNNSPNFGVHTLSKTMLVTPANALFKFAFINAFDPSHACCDAPAFLMNFKNLTTGTTTACPNFSFAPGPICIITSIMDYYAAGTTTLSSSTSSGKVYNPWKIRNIDLTPYLGNTIQIDFIICDCVYGAHYGVAYIDAECGPMPVLTNAPANQPICLPVSGTGTINAVPGFDPYLWKGPGGFSSSTQSISVSVPGNYTLTMGDSCFVTSYVVNVIATPNLTVTPFYYLCNGSALLNASGAATYTWNPGNIIGNSISPSPTITTNYTVVGANSTCTNSAISTVSVGVAPPLIVTSASLIGCQGSCFTFSNSSSAFSPFTYNWGDNTALLPMVSSHCYSVAGIYSLTASATFSSGCSVIGSGILTVTVLPLPVPVIDIAGGVTQIINAPITFHNLSSGANSFTWSFNDSSSVLNTSSMNDVIHTYTAYGTYCVKLIAMDTIRGCKDSVNRCLNVPCVSHILIPNAFSPDGDDVNEVFKFDNECIKSLNCVIYDRWGLQIYEWDKVNGGWDGHTIAGIAVTEGVYFFILNYIDSEDQEIKKTGCISVFR